MHSLSLIPCSNLYTCANRIAITHAPTPSRVLHCSTFSLLELENRGLIGPKDLITHGGGTNVIGVHQELGQTWAHSNTHTHTVMQRTRRPLSVTQKHTSRQACTCTKLQLGMHRHFWNAYTNTTHVCTHVKKMAEKGTHEGCETNTDIQAVTYLIYTLTININPFFKYTESWWVVDHHSFEFYFPNLYRPAESKIISIRWEWELKGQKRAILCEVKMLHEVKSS